MSCCCKEKAGDQPLRTGGLVPWDAIYSKFVPNTEPAPYPETCMRGNTLDCWFVSCIPERHIEHRLYQYDKGIVLNIHGLDSEKVNGIEFYLNGVKTEGTLTVVDPLASSDDPSSQDDVPSSQDDEPGTDEEPQEDNTSEEEEEIAPEDKPYFSVALPDTLMADAGSVTAYLIYKDDQSDPPEYRTIKTIYFEIMPRLSPADPDDPSEETTQEQLDAIEQEINVLCQRLCALRNRI